MNTNLIKYYKDRAEEYEKIYSKPERQEDLQKATEILQDLFLDGEVLEIACGTGYWTERIAKSAASVLATDINEPVIEIAKQKPYPEGKVSFKIADMYGLNPDQPAGSLFGGFIWSHIPLQDLDRFLQTVNGLVSPGGTVVFMDSIYVEGSNHPITRTDEHGNTYQTRKLSDGTSHLVLKNFPSGTFLEEKLSGIAAWTRIIQLDYYWILAYKPAAGK